MVFQYIMCDNYPVLSSSPNMSLLLLSELSTKTKPSVTTTDKSGHDVRKIKLIIVPFINFRTVGAINEISWCCYV